MLRYTWQENHCVMMWVLNREWAPFQLLSFEFLYVKPRENFSGVLTVYTINATELTQRQLLCSYWMLMPNVCCCMDLKGPCTYRYFHFPFVMESEKRKMNNHFSFFIFNEKWKIGVHFPFTIFHWKWKVKYEYSFSIFNFSLTHGNLRQQFSGNGK